MYFLRYTRECSGQEVMRNARGFVSASSCEDLQRYSSIMQYTVVWGGEKAFDRVPVLKARYMQWV